jgi:hypothetical protein
MPIPNSVRRALRGWRPTTLSVLTNEYERTPNFCRMHACVSSITDSISRTLGSLSYGRTVDLSAASADVLELVQRYENIVAEFGLAFRRTEEARELDIFMFASDALAREFAKLGSATGVLMS